MKKCICRCAVTMAALALCSVSPLLSRGHNAPDEDLSHSDHEMCQECCTPHSHDATDNVFTQSSSDLAMAATPKKTQRRSGATTTRKQANGTVRSVMFKDFTFDNPIFRLTESGLALNQYGFSFAGTVGVTVNGVRGHRIACIVSPIVSGSYMEDQYGQCAAVYAFTPNSDSYSANIPIAMPYQWFGIDLFGNNTDLESLHLGIWLVDFTGDKDLAEEIIELNSSNMNFRKDDVSPDMLASLLGGGVSGDVVHTCAACDGTGLCDSCYGDAYLDPSICRKCSANPGICRRCKGKGKEGSDIRYGGDSFFDIFF